MKIFGFELTRTKALPQALTYPSMWHMYSGGPLGLIQEPFAGAWQRNVAMAPTTDLLSVSTIYACVTGIASDIAKMRVKLSRNNDGIWTEVTANQPWLPVLRKPNHYQSRIKFIEQWIISKLLYGNAYILKQRKDARGIVTGLYVLHPNCVKPLVAEDGSVYYELNRDYLSEVTEDRIVIPASEIIHDMMVSLWHPLIGVSPLYACALSGTLSGKIQNNSATFFANKSMPGGMLSAPGAIGNETAARLKAAFESNFSGENIGKLFVAGDGLEFKQFAMSAESAQLVDQLKFTVEDIARAFRYPLWKLGAPMPPYTKPEMAMTAYYSDCLHPHIESLELSLDEGLELPLGSNLGTEFDLETLFRLDTEALFESNNKARGWMKTNEQRYRANLPPVEGGDTVYMQEQDHALEALARRDALPDPFGKTQASPPPATEPKPEPEPPEPTKEELEIMTKALEREVTTQLVARLAKP